MEQESNFQGCLSLLGTVGFTVGSLTAIALAIRYLPDGWWPAIFVLAVVGFGVAGLWRQFMGEDDDPDGW